ncbi:hypothetical protein [Brachyspira catarrhinii]|uniref:Uncharacterized protein n=1 Tax=Brachyspira catarrhinii TaxID=2528966 RepID=A0ABY2TU12_9SPIR|nr:hypothetical protein [Brachyspira catarrhinii]TKZ36389.1 hypothetical protein EZH24_00350 [Brachyspira catarrhinii]
MILEIFNELQILLSDLVFSGADNIDDDFIEKINLIEKKLNKFEMNFAKNLIEDLIISLKEYKKNKDIKKVSKNISKLEFYLSYALFNLSD